MDPRALISHTLFHYKETAVSESGTRLWGIDHAIARADAVIDALQSAGYQIVKVSHTRAKPMRFDIPETEEEAAEAADNGRNTGGKSYR